MKSEKRLAPFTLNIDKYCENCNYFEAWAIPRHSNHRYTDDIKYRTDVQYDIHCRHNHICRDLVDRIKEGRVQI